MEWIISGYCRAQDQARTVLLERDGGEWDCDCDFPDCAHAASCLVWKQLKEHQEEAAV